jgi:imidazolonepropionase-like amidohydrolase
MTAALTVLLADRILAGPKLKSMSGAPVTIDGDHIVAVGGPPPDVLDTVALSGTTLMPGFIDAHVHIAFADAGAVVRGGVTTARDLAWRPDEIWPLVERSKEDAFDGPRLVAAGQMLTVAGGYPMETGWAPEGTGRVVDGTTDAADAVDEQVNAGAVVIKVALNEAAGPTLPPGDLAAIVRAAHARRLAVSGHVTGLDELNKALDAELDELAHMLMSNEEIPPPTIARMVTQGMVVVPTLACRFGNDQDTAIENLSRFLHEGGRVVYGTDLGNEGPSPGIDGREIEAMAGAGMSGHQIIASATVDSARWLNLRETGVIAPGARADLVAVAGDPLANPAALTEVVGVWRGGRRVV